MPSTEMLEWLKALGAMACSWPAIALLALIVFRKPLFDLAKRFPDAESIKYGSLEIKLRKTLENMEQLHTKVERDMSDLAEKGKQAINEMGQVHAETERHMDELARKCEQAIDNMHRLSEGVVASDSFTNVTAFVHVATEQNRDKIDKNCTVIDNPFTNNNPNAILIITQHWGPPQSAGKRGVYNDQPIGVWYIHRES